MPGGPGSRPWPVHARGPADKPAIDGMPGPAFRAAAPSLGEARLAPWKRSLVGCGMPRPHVTPNGRLVFHVRLHRKLSYPQRALGDGSHRHGARVPGRRHDRSFGNSRIGSRARRLVTLRRPASSTRSFVRASIHRRLRERVRFLHRFAAVALLTQLEPTTYNHTSLAAVRRLRPCLATFPDPGAVASRGQCFQTRLRFRGREERR